MTDFGLTNRYWVHNGLDQGEVFSLLLWKIFYNPFLCEVKRQESLCGYQIDTKFVAKTDKIENQGSLILFLAAGVFVDDTIWVDSSQAATQYILDIASEFFKVNNISINNKKTVAILINQRVSDALLSISGLPISVVCKKEFHQYLGIYLSSEDLFKPSLAKTHADIRFFVNLVLKKAILDKQFLYLVLVVLQLIVSYRTQFSFLFRNVCTRWNILIRRRLRLKAELLRDFSNKAFYHPSLYGLKSFEQFWLPIHPLCCLVKLYISPVNNFLAASLFYDVSFSLKKFGVVFAKQLYTKKGLVFDWKSFQHWKKLDPRGSVSHWFTVTCDFLNCFSLSDNLCIKGLQTIDVCSSSKVSSLGQCLSSVNMRVISVYTNRSLRDLGSCEMKCGAATYFPNLNLSISAKVGRLVSLTMVELQAIALALKCVPSGSSVVVFSDTELALVSLNFHNHCWMEQHSIINLIKGKQFDHSGVIGNEYANKLANLAAGSDLVLLVLVKERFIKAGGMVVSKNKIGPGFNVINDSLFGDMDWSYTALVWHPNSHMASGFTNFVFKDWVQKATSILGNAKVARKFIVDFIQELGTAYCMDI
ncbi:hypothetical protein G9A89_006649 [Geosiphon pyriformis]|nr:hypothetical protein G9A89_006649 [Geosiphon pyriformis]